MRRFVEEIRVTNPEIAEKITTALETRTYNENDPVYEVDMYMYDGRDAIERNAYPGCCLKIFVREDVN